MSQDPSQEDFNEEWIFTSQGGESDFSLTRVIHNKEEKESPLQPIKRNRNVESEPGELTREMEGYSSARLINKSNKVTKRQKKVQELMSITLWGTKKPYQSIRWLIYQKDMSKGDWELFLAADGTVFRGRSKWRAAKAVWRLEKRSNEILEDEIAIYPNDIKQDFPSVLCGLYDKESFKGNSGLYRDAMSNNLITKYVNIYGAEMFMSHNTVTPLKRKK